jgi:hypothetical protein
MMCRFVGCIESYSFLLSPFFLFLILVVLIFNSFSLTTCLIVCQVGIIKSLLLIDTLSLLLPGQIEMVSRTKYW